MFELFIALFGGLFYGTKILSEKSSLKASNARRKRRSEVLRSLFCDTATECRVIDSLAKSDSRFVVLNTIADELKYLFGDDWMDYYKPGIDLPSNYISTSKSYKTGLPWWMAENILVAKQGKISTLMCIRDLIGSDEAVDVQKKTLGIMEKYIQKYHPNYYLVITPDNSGYISCVKGYARWDCRL